MKWRIFHEKESIIYSKRGIVVYDCFYDSGMWESVTDCCRKCRYNRSSGKLSGRRIGRDYGELCIFGGRDGWTTSSLLDIDAERRYDI